MVCSSGRLTHNAHIIKGGAVEITRFNEIPYPLQRDVNSRLLKPDKNSLRDNHLVNTN